MARRLGTPLQTGDPQDVADKPGEGYFRGLYKRVVEVREYLETALAEHLLALLTTAGDIIVRGASAVQRLGVGAATTNQVLTVDTTLAHKLKYAAPQASALAGTVAIANGGTGQVTATAAFDALDPLTTKGDMIAHDGTNSVRVAAPSQNGRGLVSNSGATPGLQWGYRHRTANKQSDESRTSTALADVAGLTFSLESGCNYVFEFEVYYSTAVNTTGLQLAVNGPAAVVLYVSSEIMISATAGTDQIHSQMATAYDTAHNPGSSAGGTRLMARMRGLVATSASGTLALRFATEVAASSVTIYAGSWGRLRQTFPADV